MSFRFDQPKMCDERKDRFGIEESKSKEPKYRPTKASLDGFMEES